jgi:transcriptional regulator with XRE-family HTH domain
MDGRKIRDLRIERNISLTELSKISGVSKSYLSFIERGKQKNPGIDIIEKIAKALNVDVHALLMNEAKRMDPSQLDEEVLNLAWEMTRSNIDKEKLKQLIQLLK